MNETALALILDRSGSMASIADNALSGANEFIQAHAAEQGGAAFTLVLFDHEYLVLADHVPASSVALLDGTTYEPRGSTALLDAIARTIDSLAARLAMEKEEDRPKSVIVAILTDGYENASRHNTWAQVQDRIVKYTAEGWEFLYLGANQDAIATAGRMGMDQTKAATFTADAKGAETAKDVMRMKSLAKRRMMAGRGTAEDASIDSMPAQAYYYKMADTQPDAPATPVVDPAIAAYAAAMEARRRKNETAASR